MTIALLLVPVAALLGVVVWDLVRTPEVRRLAVKRGRRRPVDALFVVLGSLLATAIISSSFVVGDTLGASIRDMARTQYGPADEAVVASGLDAVPAIEEALAEPVPGTDGVLPMTSAPITATRVLPDGERRTQARTLLHEVDVPAAQGFGGRPGDTGFADAEGTPEPGTALVGEDLAEDLGAQVGDELEVFAYGKGLEVEVREILPRIGVAGFYPLTGSRSPVLFVAPGTLEEVLGDQQVPLPPTVRFLFSDEGGVFDGAQRGPAVRQELSRRVQDVPGAEVQGLKQQVLDAAEAEGRAVTQLFTGIGGFAVIAGVLLLVNLFVMQAEERKRELGLLRAVGMRRNRLARVFGFEGGLLALAATAIGAAAGVVVARVIVSATAELLTQVDTTLDLRFSATATSLVTGALIGLVISLATIWLTSIRIGRLEVVEAVSELSRAAPERPSTMRLVGAALAVCTGGALLAVGILGQVAMAALVGPVLSAFCAIPLLGRLLPGRLAVSVPCVAALVWGVAAFAVLPEVFERSEIPVFLVQGVLLVATGATLITARADASRGITARLLGRGRMGLAVRLGFAYPLARPVRTGLLVGMYALVTFTLTFTAVFTSIFSDQVAVLTDATSAGADMLVDSNPVAPVPEEDLRAADGVAATAPIVRGLASVEHPALGPEPRMTVTAGIDESLLAAGVPALTERDPTFRDDAAAWRAVLRDPTLAVVSDLTLQRTGGFPRSPLEVGERFRLVDPSADSGRELTVAGVATADVQLNGILVQREVLEGLLGPRAVTSRHYVTLEDGADAEDVAGRLESELYRSGVDARTFRDVVDEALTQQRGFFRLMQGFLSLGLVVGVAGLVVVMVRAVRERRRQIGMLLAIGYESRLVRSAFLVEAAFVAARGVLLGGVLGLVVSYSLLVHSEALAGAGLRFVVPWTSLALVMGAPLVLSLLAAVLPASRAAQVSPSAAMRLAH